MKITGTEHRTVSSMSENVLRVKQETAISNTTQELSAQGKHVVNIIHGQITQCLGTWEAPITFLWEADDEDPAYKAVIARELLEEKIKEMKKDIFKLTRKITNIKEYTPLDPDEQVTRNKKESWFLLVTANTVMVMCFVIESWLMFTVSLLVVIYATYCVIKTMKEECTEVERGRTIAKNEEMEREKEALLQYEKELSEKKDTLEKMMESLK